MSAVQTVRLDQCCEIISGATPKTGTAEFWDGGICWVTPKDLSNLDGAYIDDTPRKITEAGLNNCSAAILPERSVLFSSRAPIGHVAINRKPMATNQGFKSFVPHAGKVHPEYLYHWLRTNRSYLESLGNGATFKEVSKAVVSRIEVPLPPLLEQRRIADILDKADALRAQRRAALAELDALTQSIFLDLFGDPVRNERKWPTESVAALCNLVRGSSPRPQGDARYFGGPVPRLMVADITRDGWSVTPVIDSLTVEGAKRSRPVTAGTVVMAVSGNVGLVSRLAIDACVHDGFVAFTSLDEFRCEPGFLLALLHFSKSVHDKSKAGAIFINLTTTDIKAMQVILPSLEQQQEFARRITAIETLKSRHRAALAELDTLFASLQHRAFRGEL